MPKELPEQPDLEHVPTLVEPSDPAAALHAAFVAGHAALVGKLLATHPELKARINEPIGPFDSPAIN